MTTATRPARVALRSTWGRWTVEAYASPARRGGESYSRARVLCRCVCGTPQLVFEADLKRRHTQGCKSMRCHFGWVARQQLLAQLAGLPGPQAAHDDGGDHG